jgi:uncharacterized membrane protein
MTASIFILVSGLSVSLSSSRRRQLKRGAEIFLLGMLVTVVTWLYVGGGFIVFGILHFIGLSVMISKPFVRLGKKNLLIACAVILTGIWLYTMDFGFPWLVWAGFAPEGFYSLDYVPMMPWFGVFLCGIYLGNRFYAEGKRRFHLPEPSKRVTGFPCWLGRHSLTIYLVHQVIIVAIISILF